MTYSYKGLKIRVITTGSDSIILAYDQNGNRVELPEELKSKRAADDFYHIYERKE